MGHMHSDVEAWNGIIGPRTGKGPRDHQLGPLIVHLRTQKTRDGEALVQNQLVRKWQSWDPHPGLVPSPFLCFTTLLWSLLPLKVVRGVWSLNVLVCFWCNTSKGQLMVTFCPLPCQRVLGYPRNVLQEAGPRVSLLT